MVGKTGSELERIWSKFMELERRINELEAKQPTAPKQSEEARELFAQAEFPAKPTPNPQETVAKLLDLADMPRYNPITNTTGRSDRDVSEGKVYLHPTWKVACLEHGAMNCVNEQRTIWRCLTCGRGAYAPEPLVAEPHVVQTPQESSPGFEEAARQILFRVHSSQPLGLDYKDAVKAILAVHNDDIQEAKREGLRAFIEFDAGPRCKEKDNDCYCCKMWEHYDEYLRVLEEETT